MLGFITDLAKHKQRDLDRIYRKEDGTYKSGTIFGQDIMGVRNKKKINKKLPYFASKFNVNQEKDNACVMIDGAPYAFMNRLTVSNQLAALYNAKNSVISSLQPKIKLYKVIFQESEGGDIIEEEVEMHFDTHMTREEMNIFKEGKSRGHGVGIKSFNFTYDGSNPFAVKKSIKANLKIFANTFSDLFRLRENNKNQTYSYLDLALKTWNTAAEQLTQEDNALLKSFYENVAKNELDFRLKAEVGLALPPSKMKTVPIGIRNALSESFVTLQLTPTVHNFEFDEMGRVVFNINFLAYIEQFMDTKNFNVFSGTEVSINRFEREFKMETAGQRCNSEQTNQLKREYAEDVREEKQIAISSLMSEMMSRDLIYDLSLDYKFVDKFTLLGPYADYDRDDLDFRPLNSREQRESLQNLIDKGLDDTFSGVLGDDATDEDRKRAITAALVGNIDKEANLSFFYLSDLVDTILSKIGRELEDLAVNGALEDMLSKSHTIPITLEQIEEKSRELRSSLKAFKKFRVLLGPVEFVRPRGSDKPLIRANLGDIPISVRYFVEWLTSVMIAKEEIYYPLTKFMNDLINNLVKNFLNNESCFTYKISQKTRLQQASITAYGNSSELDPVTERITTSGQFHRYRVVEDTGFQNGVAGAVQRTIASTQANIAFRAHISDFDDFPILRMSGPPGEVTKIPINNMYNFFVYSVSRTMPTELMKGDKGSDERRGIFHYKLGRRRGFLKNVKLSKTQTKGLAEVRFEQEGYDGLSQLRVIYDAQIDLFASVSSFPGQYIFIDPRGFAPDMPLGLAAGSSGYDRQKFGLTKLGIGGYYMIVRSEHEFSSGKANTILHTKWVNQIETEADGDLEPIPSTAGVGDRKAPRCHFIELEDDEAEEVDE